jgi:Tfp pilus assembly major pilin PilA
MSRRPTAGQAGQSLLQLLLTVAVMGVLGIITVRLMRAVLVTSIKEKASLDLHQGSRQARDMLVAGLRNASASSVIITRQDSTQPPMSKVCFIDAGGNSITFFQEGRRFYRGTWTSTTATVDTRAALLNNFVERFNVYYPNVKNINQISFALMARASPMSNTVKTVELLTTGDIEMKAP